MYALCALLLTGCMSGRQSSSRETRSAGKETIDSLAPNPFIRHMYTADPSARVWADGRLYVYASHVDLHVFPAARSDSKICL